MGGADGKESMGRTGCVLYDTLRAGAPPLPLPSRDKMNFVMYSGVLIIFTTWLETTQTKTIMTTTMTNDSTEMARTAL